MEWVIFQIEVVLFEDFEKMGLGPDAIRVGAWNVEKSDGKKKKDDEDGGTGCWLKFRFMGSCLSSKAKVDGSISGSGTSTLYGKILFID